MIYYLIRRALDVALSSVVCGGLRLGRGGEGSFVIRHQARVCCGPVPCPLAKVEALRRAPGADGRLRLRLVAWAHGRTGAGRTHSLAELAEAEAEAARLTHSGAKGRTRTHHGPRPRPCARSQSLAQSQRSAQAAHGSRVVLRTRLPDLPPINQRRASSYLPLPLLIPAQLRAFTPLPLLARRRPQLHRSRPRPRPRPQLTPHTHTHPALHPSSAFHQSAHPICTICP